MTADENKAPDKHDQKDTKLHSKKEAEVRQILCEFSN